MIKFGGISFDTLAYASQGAAVLGIRDSGKTYTATLLAEKLFDAGVPFIAFDPVGVWRFLRVPGKGRGYPVVVAGGQEGDLPLSPATAPAIVEAAMQQGISLVIDLFSMELSKSDWRKIVRDCVLLLLHKNKPHGLRHVFIEEAAEFCPQKVWDGEVYAAVEKLARMGGNSRLGYTLINQRAEEVNKAVLELCDNLFLHRQKGKNSLTSLQKWLDVGNAKGGKAIIDTLSTLPSGECWAWMAGTETPVHVKVPAKNSLHPDRRVMRDTESKPAAAVDVGAFVSALQAALPKVEAEAKANDPKALKARVADLEKQLRAKSSQVAPAVDLTHERSVGYNAGWSAAMKDVAKIRGKQQNAVATARMLLDRAIAALPTFDSSEPPLPVAATPRAISAPRPPKPATARTADAPDGISGRHMKVLNGVAWWLAAGIDEPSRAQVAGAAVYAPNNGNFNNLVGALKTSGLVEYPTPGTVRLTDEGAATAEQQDAPTTEDLHARVRSIISPRHVRIFDAALAAYPESLTRDQLAEASGYQAGNGNFNNLVGKMKTLGFIEYPSPGSVKAADWLFL